VSLKKHGLDLAQFAIKTSEEYTGRCIDAWEAVTSDDPCYGLYQEALKELRNHDYGKRYIERRARLLRYALERDANSQARLDRHQTPAASGQAEDQ
jgi:hypothetical protein